jgi:hypothetical protein
MLLAGPVGAVPLLPVFSADMFDPGASITNTYFPLLPGQSDTLVAMGVDEDGEAFSEHTERSFAGEGPEILGVRTTRMLDRAYEGDLLVEETYDFHAQDKLGNVWYLGEDVTNYRYDDDGNLIGTDSESAWRADGVVAFPGWIMPASTELGLSYYQEFAPEDDALDEGLTVAILDSLQAGGAFYYTVLKVLESTAVEPGAFGIKYYAPGIGLIREEEGVNADMLYPELVFNRVVVPLPAPLALLLGALAAMGAVAGRRPRR